ncbi:MAG: hypothetical protein AB4426_16820 [Xenococcaceae cyanobacterium]
MTFLVSVGERYEAVLFEPLMELGSVLRRTLQRVCCFHAWSVILAQNNSQKEYIIAQSADIILIEM